MKYLTIVILTVGLLASGCSNTKLLKSWKNKEHIPQQFNTLAIAAITPNEENRSVTEEAIVANLSKNGIEAVATYETMPRAGRLGNLQSSSKASEGLKKIIRSKIEENNIDGLLILSVFNKKVEDRWVNDHSYAPPGAGYYGVPFGFAGRYYDYYYYSMGAMYGDGYYVQDVTYYIECSLYDVVEENILWSGQISVKNIESIELEADKVGYIIARQLTQKKILSQ